MRLGIIVFLVLLGFNSNLSNANDNLADYFIETESCSSREPILINNLKKSNDVYNINLRLSENRLDVNNKNAKIVVSLTVDDDLVITGLLLQTKLTGSERLLGSWNIHGDVRSSNQIIKTLDCDSNKDTLIAYSTSENSLNNKQLEWNLNFEDFKNDISDNSAVYFIATIINSNNEYFLNVKSDEVKLITKKSILESVSNSVVEVNSRSKRDLTKQFEASLNQCGSRKSCFVSLKTCDTDPKTCNFVLNWEYDGELINYELTALSVGWVGVVFSEDQYLGDDNLVVCSKFGEDKLSIDHYFKRKDSSQLIKLEPEDYLKKKFITFNPSDGYIYCKFSRPKFVDDKYVTDLNKPHHIYVERGVPGDLIVDKLASSFQPSESKIEFANSIYVPVSARSWLVKVHAILGIIAWIFLGSIGILLARYYKPLWPSHVLNSYRVWFTFHRPMMVTVTLLTLLSLLFALIELDWQWSANGHDLLHSILGLIVIICSCINPILGLFRPDPTSALRCFWFWCHWLVGAVAYCLAVPTIFIGMDLAKSDIPNWCAWLLFFWVIFHIVVEIILEVHYCCTFAQLQGNYNEKNLDYDRINKQSTKKKNPPGYRWKPSLLLLYTTVTAIVVGILIIAIILFDA